MIVKYFKDGVWGYIDNVRQVASKDIECSEYIQRYDEEVKEGLRKDISIGEHETITKDIIDSNKVFLVATELLPPEIAETNYHAENFVNIKQEYDIPCKIIMLYLNDHKEYETVVFVTNQTVYLMNDNGKTIERLV